ncbi:MAG: DUF4168 domain-containing protein [Sphingomonas sp.]
MTRFATMAALLGATTLCGTAALAQMAPQTTPPATPPTASQTAPQTTPPAASQAAPGAAASYTDADVDQFAGAALAVQKIQQDTTVPDTDKQTKMSAAVTSSGLTPEKFNAMATASQSDPALMKRIQTAAAAKMKASPPSAGASGAAGSTGSAGTDGATAR